MQDQIGTSPPASLPFRRTASSGFAESAPRRIVTPESPVAGSRRLSITAAARPTMQPDDPRWLLARRVSEQLRGGRAAVLPPEARTRLGQLGARLGLRPFDVSLIVAIVQDSARHSDGESHAVMMERLRLIPNPGPTVKPWVQKEPGSASLLPWVAVALTLATGIVVAAVRWISAG